VASDFELEWYGDKLIDDLEREAAAEVKQAADVVLKDCNPPVDEGDLRDSGHVEVWSKVPYGTVGASVVYDAPHAHLLHENPAYYELSNGEDKWLERATERRGDDVLRGLQTRIGGVLGGD